MFPHVSDGDTNLTAGLDPCPGLIIWLGAQLVQVMTGSRHSSPLAPDIAAVSWGKGRGEDPAEKRVSEKRCSKMQAHPSAHLPTVTSVPETQVL